MPQGAEMLCPIDKTPLVMSERQNIEIDYCPTCRGVWLDRGELDKTIERSADAAAPAPPRPRRRSRSRSRASQAGATTVTATTAMAITASARRASLRSCSTDQPALHDRI